MIKICYVRSGVGSLPQGTHSGGVYRWDTLAAPIYRPRIYTLGSSWHRSWHQMG